MLSLKEKYIMEYLYQRCMGKKSSLITPREVISFIADKYVMYPNELDKIMTNLSFDNYIDLVKSDKQGEPIFCISLKMKGEGFHRELSNAKKTWLFYIGRTLLLALLAGVIGIIFKLVTK